MSCLPFWREHCRINERGVVESRTQEMGIMYALEEAPGQASAGEGSPSRLGEVLEFMRLLWAVDHQLQSTSKRMEAQLGMTGPQRLVVRLVGQYPGISAGRLAQVMHLHPSTLTGILKRLVLRGLLKREVDPLDARRARFTLSEAGRAQDVPASGTVEAGVQRAFARVSTAQLMGAREVLIALAEELGVENTAPLLSPRARDEQPGAGMVVALSSSGQLP
jgi:MarR family transcriptional regulator, organic hydroperoxide resistance regulator